MSTLRRSLPDAREVERVFGRRIVEYADDDRDVLTPEEIDDLEDSGLTLHEWLHPEAAKKREMERNQ